MHSSLPGPVQARRGRRAEGVSYGVSKGETMNTTMKILGFVLLLCTTLSAEAASVRKAKMLNEHGLRAEAKRELVDVLFSAAGGNEKAEAYYLLGSIAFSEKRITTALNTWNSLVEEYPGSKHAALVNDKASELAEIVGESTDEAINNAVAQSYLRHAEFWSEDKDSVFRIDSEAGALLGTP